MLDLLASTYFPINFPINHSFKNGRLQKERLPSLKKILPIRSMSDYFVGLITEYYLSNGCKILVPESWLLLEIIDSLPVI